MMETHTFVVNLPARKDRRWGMEQELRRIGWAHEFFPAIAPTDMAPFHMLGVKGCYLSHLAVLEEAKRRGVDRLILLEDDLNFSDDFEQHWPGCLAALNSQAWDIFFPVHGSKPGVHVIDSTQHLLCAHFVVFNHTVIPRLINALNVFMSRPLDHPLGGPMPVDGAYSVFREQNPDVVALGHFPHLGYQRSSKSDITPKWFDNIPAVGPLIGAARRAKVYWQ